jgi:hypothetical protein
MTKFAITIILVTFLFSMTSWGKYEIRTFSWSHKIMSPEDESQLVELFDHIINDKVIQLPKYYVDNFYRIGVSYHVDHNVVEPSTPFSCLFKKKKKPSSLFIGSLSFRGPDDDDQKIKLKTFHTKSEKDCLSLKNKLEEISWQSIIINKRIVHNYVCYTKVIPQLIYECDKNNLKSIFMIDYVAN